MSTLTSESLAEIRVANNPFPGLRPFEFDESHLFFGRDGQSEQLIGKLSRTHFLAVVGTSGSGKSSLVRAGFLPALYGGFMTSAGSAWRVAILRPGNDPIGNLARALNAPDVFGSELEANSAIQTAIAESTLRRGSLGLVDTLRQAVMVEGENLLIVVDQFEEIFRFAKVAEGEQYGNEAAAFIKLLLEAARQREVPIYVVLTMRSDYLGDCSQFWGLPEAINESQYLIPRLTRDQLREAISGPVAVGGGNITPRLVNRLLNDVGDNQDQLPVLQHLLMRSWHEWKEKRLLVEVKDGEQVVHRPHKEVHQGDAIDLCCAEAVGGMAEALSRHADEAYFELPNDHHREVAAKLFKALTEKGTDNREIRRPISLGEISSITGARQDEVITVIEAFRQPGRSFLMPPAPLALNSESLVDISHESLIRGWSRLKDWVDEEARSARIYRRVAETAVLYKEGGAGLWRDPDLQIALSWREQGKPNEVWARRYHSEFALAERFLDESVAARDAQVLKDEAQRRKEINRSRLTALIFGVAFLFSLAMGAYAYGAKSKAESAQIEAVKAKNDALAQKKVADQAKDDALAQKKVADDAKDDAFAQKAKADDAKNDALAQKKAADEAKNDALAQKKAADEARNDALAQKDRATAEALKGQALGELKEQNPDKAIDFFKELETLYRDKENPGGVSFALASIADIHRDRAPLSILAELEQNSVSLGYIDEDESNVAKKYYKALVAMSSFSTEGGTEDTKKEMFNEANLAVTQYHLALDANKANKEPDRFLKEGNILKNLADLQIGLAEMAPEFASEETDKMKLEDQVELDIQKGIFYYRDATQAYRNGGLHEKEGEVLQKTGDVLLRNFTRKLEAKAKESNEDSALTDPMVLAELDSIIDYFRDANDAFKRAQKPLLQAAVLGHIGLIYATVYKDVPEKAHESLRPLEEAGELYKKARSFRLQALVDGKLAELHEGFKDDEKAVAFYKQAFVAFLEASLQPKNKTENLSGVDDTIKKIGTLLFKKGGKVEANRFFEQAISSGNDPESKSRLLTRIAEFYKGIDNAEAFNYYQRKREVWRAAGNFVEEGNALFVIGQMQKESNDNAGAIRSFEDAREAYRHVDPTKTKGAGKAVADLMAIARFYFDQDKQKAVSTYEEALRIDMLTGGSSAQQLVQSLGNILLQLKTEEARARTKAWFEKVIAFQQSKKNREGETSSLSSAGDLFASAGDSAEARGYYDRLRTIYVGSKNIYGSINVLKKIGELEVVQNPQTTIVDYYLREVESAGRTRDLFSQATALEAIASFYRDKKELQQAIDYFERAREAYHTLRIPSQEISTIRAMGYVYSELGNKPKAEELRKRADELSKLPR
jgi:tetratricopeptide (TPR) repeat protein